MRVRQNFLDFARANGDIASNTFFGGIALIGLDSLLSIFLIREQLKPGNHAISAVSLFFGDINIDLASMHAS